MSRILNWLLAFIVLAAIGALLLWTGPWILAVLAVAPLAVGVAFARHRWLAARARRAFLATWAPVGKRILLVYSNSPHWQNYIEDRWLPRLRDRVVILNWSERRQWATHQPVEAAIFRGYAGLREFNPLAIVFPQGGETQVIRFWRAFRDFKHGKADALSAAERALFAAAGVDPP